MNTPLNPSIHAFFLHTDFQPIALKADPAHRAIGFTVTDGSAKALIDGLKTLKGGLNFKVIDSAQPDKQHVVIASPLDGRTIRYDEDQLHHKLGIYNGLLNDAIPERLPKFKVGTVTADQNGFKYAIIADCPTSQIADRVEKQAINTTRRKFKTIPTDTDKGFCVVLAIPNGSTYRFRNEADAQHELQALSRRGLNVEGAASERAGGRY